MEIVCPACASEEAYFNGVCYECPNCDHQWGEIEPEEDEDDDDAKSFQGRAITLPDDMYIPDSAIEDSDED